jgi:hypothetical protein
MEKLSPCSTGKDAEIFSLNKGVLEPLVSAPHTDLAKVRNHVSTRDRP